MPLTAGSKLGPYEIVSFIGAGGMGEVYKARDLRLQRDVALKLLPHSFAADGDRLNRFEQEARAVAALSHPNILAVHDIGQHDGSPFFVSEFLEGESLHDALARGALSNRRALDYAIQITHGLSAAHRKNIAHRDLKPDNIFITKEGRVKILDFGLAKAVQTSVAHGMGGGAATMTAAAPITEVGTVMGTVGYVPVPTGSISSVHVDKVNPLTGASSPWRDLALPPVGGVIPEAPIITPDGQTYGFGNRLRLWDLYTVSGVR